MTTNYIQINNNSKLYHGKSEDVITTLDDNSIDLIITSPPYNVDLGNNKFNKNPYDMYNDNKDHDAYIAWLKNIFWQVWPKLKDGGRVAINIGDGKNGCYDDKTEILTKMGWKFFKDLNKSDEVLTINKDKKKIEYEIPSEVQIYDYHGEMYKIKSYTLDLCVTPNHRMMVERHHTHGWFIDEIQNLNQRQYKIPRNYGDWTKEEINYFDIPPVYIKNYKRISKNIRVKMDDWIEFLGWFSTEGCSYKYNKNKYFVIITQSPEKNKENYNQIISLLDRMNFNYNLKGKNIEICSKQLYYSVYKTGKCYKKYFPINLSILSKRQLKILFETAIKGDGCNHSNGQIRFYSTSKKLYEQMQIIGLKIGYSARLNVRNKKKAFIKGKKCKVRKCYELIFTDKKNYYFDTKRNLTKEEYKGKVYCCSTKNGIVYVRRNGTSVWCGNSVPTHVDIIHFMTKKLNYLPMANIIWNKSQIGNRFSWGSYMSPSCPSFPKPFEYIMVFAKDNIKLQEKGETDLTPIEFKKWAFSIWDMAPETKQKKIGHPAIFPIELPYRLIKMLSWKNATILDPFNGSGTTGVACKQLGRKYVGIEMSKKYCDLTEKRINDTPYPHEINMFTV